MTPNPEDLAAQYAQMSETELMKMARSYDGLLEIAQVALRAEFARRGLEPPLVEEPEEWELRRLMTVRRYRDLAEAYMGRSLLESAGIPAWIADEHLVRTDWFYSNLVGGMRLQVDEREEAAAREILEEGAPETIKTMLAHVPSDYDETYKWYTRRGSRVLALGMKEYDSISMDRVCFTSVFSELVPTVLSD